MYRSSMVVVERHTDRHVAHPFRPKDVVAGAGDMYAKALKDIEWAIKLYNERFGEDMLDPDLESPCLKPLW
ncbi:MAG TPA: type II toxin-antitoxin system HicB family antitoxin [Candidatus Hydrogenedentes bacterium]|nr:type II toxin-antitoxin system HicB family antitoxin [Candidatus Hydrogenedentota bacterium]